MQFQLKVCSILNKIYYDFLLKQSIFLPLITDGVWYVLYDYIMYIFVGSSIIIWKTINDNGFEIFVCFWHHSLEHLHVIESYASMHSNISFFWQVCWYNKWLLIHLTILYNMAYVVYYHSWSGNMTIFANL